MRRASGSVIPLRSRSSSTLTLRHPPLLSGLSIPGPQVFDKIPVASDRVAHRGKVRTDLMGTSRFEPDSNRLKGPWHATTVTVRVDIIARMTVDRMTVEQKTKKPGARYRAPGPTRC